ncbi:MAG: Fe-Mn family superoxide dismutase [Defluviitaleaceae bacterium]|nr:Fe-Mn family superoxide dismutase [Defluviitaleaceae bacterium]
MEISALNFPHTTSVVSRKQFDDHVTLYQGYVTMTNETDKTLATQPEYETASPTGGHFRGWKKTETYAIDGVILHELYFQNLGSQTTAPGPKMQGIFGKYYGGFDKWKDDFTATAKSARGWVILAYEQRTATCRNVLMDLHDEGQILSMYPLIILDMYEHAYFLDYGTDKATYISRFLSNLPWDVIEKRAVLL